MPKFKLADGTEFDIKAAPLLDDRTLDLMDFTRAEVDAEKPERYVRGALAVVMPICSVPDVSNKLTPADIAGLADNLEEILALAMGEEYHPEDESKNAERPEACSSGSGPGLPAGESTPESIPSEAPSIS